MTKEQEESAASADHTKKEVSAINKDHDIDSGSGSGSENGEKPVREKLKQTDLEEGTAEVPVAVNGSASSKVPATLKKKRSYKDLVHEEGVEPVTPSEGAHARKKTREARTPIALESGSTLKDIETIQDEGDAAKHSDDNSDKIIATPPSSEDEAQPVKIKKKRSSEEMGETEELLRSPKVAATNAERERRSSSARLSDTEVGATDKNNEKPVAPRSVPEAEQKSEDNSTTVASGFANTSSTSPFATMGTSSKSATNKDLPQTSASAFAGSGFAALANSTSAFGSLAKGNPSGSEEKPQTSASAFAGSGFAALASSGSAFGSLAKAKSPIVEDKPQTSASAFAGSGFASLAGSGSPFAASSETAKPLSSFGASPFAAGGKSSGFGSSSSAFGSSPFGSGFGGSKLSAFAAPASISKFASTSTAKPFGAPEVSDDENEDDDNDDKSDDEAGVEGEEENNSSFGGEKSTQYKIQKDQTTGEEDESTAFTANAKLFQFVPGTKPSPWIERGLGPFKLNFKITNESGESHPELSDVHFRDIQPGEAKVDARFLLRNAATHKVILNARVFKEQRIGALDGSEPQDKQQFFFSATSESGGLTGYLLKFGRKDSSTELYDQVKKIQGLL